MTNDPELRALIAKLEKRLNRFKERLSRNDKKIFGQYWLDNYERLLSRGSQVFKKADALRHQIINLQCEEVHFVHP